MPFDPLQRRTPSGLAPRHDLTQGALVSGLRLPRYGSGSYSGFLITARCDLAHVRTDTVNLLPIVPLAEWIRFDGCIVILLARLLALDSRIDEIAETLPPALRSIIGSDWKVGYDLFIADSPDIPANTKQRLRACVEEYDALHRILNASGDSPSAIANAIATDPVFRDLVARETPKKISALLENKILDAHFLPVIRPNEPLANGPGYVILFRQILAIPGALLPALKAGLASPDDLSEPLRAPAAQSLVFPAELVANVTSPYVEHILQKFSNVFARVGVTDCSKRYRDWLVTTACEPIHK